MRVLIVEDEPIIRQFCTLVLENYFEKCEIVEAPHSEVAIDKMKAMKFDFIISDFDMPGGNGDILVQYLKSIEWQGSYLLHTSNHIDDLPYIKEFVLSNVNRNYAQKPTRLKELVEIIRETLKREEVKSDYKKVRISYFLRNNKSLCDIFIKLNDEKFIKIINKGEFYKKSDIDKYIKKNQKYLYILESDMVKFSNHLYDTPFLEFVSEFGAQESIEDNLVRTHAVLKDLVESVGVDKYAIKLADSYVGNVSEITKDDKNISSMLFKLRQRRDYIYDHSYMCACLSVFIVKQLPWSSNEIIQKLCFSALFHDITLKSAELAMIHDLEESSVRKLTKEEKTSLANHPKDACKLLSGAKEFSQDIENIITNHHENGEGTGFPRKIDGTQMRPLTCVFIVAHEFVRQLYLRDFDEHSHKDILTVLFNRYNSGSFKDILDALYKTLSLNEFFEEGM